MSRNEIILSFHESLLKHSDIELLQGPYWLNDTIISFYFEYLEVKRFRRNASLLFVPPQVTQCIKITPSTEINVFLEPLKSNRRRFIFFALNDNERTDMCGGSHWSLLAFSHTERMVYHFDSSRGSNQEQAVEFGEKLLRYFGYPYHGFFKEANCLQQSNGYDCGVHVLCNVEKTAEYALKRDRIEGCPLVEHADVLKKRKDVLNLIYDMSRQ